MDSASVQDVTVLVADRLEVPRKLAKELAAFFDEEKKLVQGEYKHTRVAAKAAQRMMREHTAEKDFKKYMQFLSLLVIERKKVSEKEKKLRKKSAKKDAHKNPSPANTQQFAKKERDETINHPSLPGIYKSCRSKDRIFSGLSDHDNDL